MAQLINKGLDVPYQSPVINDEKKLTLSWQNFFRALYKSIYGLGTEASFELNNNQATAIDIDGLQFNFQKTTYVDVDFVIQRVTQSIGREELMEAGSFQLVYRPYDKSWDLKLPASHWPDNSGVVLSVTTDGQMQYTTTNIGGIPRFSKITYRARTLDAKVTG